MEEIQITSKYTLLSVADYIKLNHALSVAKGYDLVKDTARCFQTVPQLAKVDIVTDVNGVETFSLACIALVDIEAQERFPELLTGITLVESYTPAETSIEELVAEGLTKEQIDWELQHLRFFNDGLKVIWMESEAPSVESELICEELSASGITVLIVDSNGI